MNSAQTTVDRIERCGRGNELGAHNRAVQRLCLATSPDSDPALMAKVLTHEAVHVAQDCLMVCRTVDLPRLLPTSSATVVSQRQSRSSSAAIRSMPIRLPATASCRLNKSSWNMRLMPYKIVSYASHVRNRCSTAQG